MKKLFITLAVLTIGIRVILPQASAMSYEAYLVTCGPGTETYSIYGHSALRILNRETGEDLAYNWGVFDFSTPNFVWKFAKGRLDYMLAVYPFDRFVNDYIYEKRWVISQKINLEPAEMEQLLLLLAENLKPENIAYRYDFFYDDCSTRIRDLIEKSLGEKLIYPPEDPRQNLTFRAKVSEYQRPFPWLNTGIDLIMGTPADKKAGFREVMFLPLDMQEGLSEAVVNRSGRMIPLLANPETIVSFPDPAIKTSPLKSPVVIFAFIFIFVVLLSAIKPPARVVFILDLLLFSVFSLLSVMVFFFSFFTDHDQMKMNLNLLWLSPFVLPCFAGLFLGRRMTTWYKIVFYLCILYMTIFLIFPGGFNNSFLPVVLILALRSSIRAGFSWNPMKLDSI